MPVLSARLPDIASLLKLGAGKDAAVVAGAHHGAFPAPRPVPQEADGNHQGMTDGTMPDRSESDSRKLLRRLR
ncbi:MAG: hypothetical protein Q8K20_08545, partial [Gemmobacter sp.]|nr:hypothetical protein [Gemmobacter sp.]